MVEQPRPASRRWRRPERRREPFSLLGVGLLGGLGSVEGRMLHAGIEDTLQRRVPRQIDLEATGIEHLWYQAEIGDGRLIAVAEGAGTPVLRDRRLIGIEAGL